MKKKFSSRKIIFYIVAVLLPFVVWLSIEFIANKITHRFDPLKVDNKKGTLYLNQDYFTDFFLFDLDQFWNTSSSNRAIHQEKGDRFRIVTLGGSTTAGYPYNTLPQYKCPASFPNYLRAILQYNKDLPEIEMLNLGSNAFNSLSVLKVFNDIKKYDPDLVIVYSGHNEYFGPNEFALSKSTNKIFSSKFFFNGYLSLRQTYLYQGMRWILKKIMKRGEVEYKDYAKWSLQNTISADDEYNRLVRKNYEKNLTELAEMAKKSGIKLVLCTPISNVTFPPFHGQFSKALDSTTVALWDTLEVQAGEMFDKGQFDDALAVWKKLYEIDSTNANVHYYAGMNYAKLKEYKIADMALERATDLDALPFRAKSFIRDVCRKVAKRENVILADTDLFFRQISQKYYPEPSLLLDHVHPTEPGYYYVALFLARTLLDNHVFPDVKEIKFPTLEQTREALGIYDFVAYKVEYDFTKDSYLSDLGKINPAIGALLMRMRENAITRAKKIGQELMKEDYEAAKKKE